MADVPHIGQGSSSGFGHLLTANIHRDRTLTTNARIHDKNRNTDPVETGFQEYGFLSLGVHGGDQ